MQHERQRSSVHGTRRALAAGLGLLLAVACIPTGDKGGTDPIIVDTRLPQIDGGALEIPAQCQVSSGQTPPALVNFRFLNQGAVPVYFRGVCAPEFAVGSCASNYTDDLTARGSSGCACENLGQCPVGGPCVPLKAEIAAGDSLTVSWLAKIWVRATTVGGVECNSPVDVPHGLYEVRMALFADATAAQAGTPVARTVRRKFSWPGDQAVVDVPITP